MIATIVRGRYQYYVEVIALLLKRTSNLVYYDLKHSCDLWWLNAKLFQ